MIVDPLGLILHEHARQERMCRVLEEIAAELPGEFNRERISGILSSVERGVALHILDSEAGLFPFLERRSRPEDNIDEMLSQLALEHATDECSAGELIDFVDALSDSESPENLGVLAQMLRTFLASYQRHLAWEHAVVLPFARKHLTPEELQQCAHVLMSHRTVPQPPDHIQTQ